MSPGYAFVYWEKRQTPFFANATMKFRLRHLAVTDAD